MDFDLNIKDDQWELNLNIDDSDIRLTPVLCPSMSTQSCDVSEDENFKSGPWVSATDYVNANGGIVSGCLGDIKNFLNSGKLDQVVAIIKFCSPNVIGDLIMTMKDLSGTIPGTIHHKVIGEGGYGKDIIVRSALILANVSVFSLKPSKHYNENVVKVFRKDTIPGSESGSGKM
ncbi:GPCR kinase [Tanacetum coccineum]